MTITTPPDVDQIEHLDWQHEQRCTVRSCHAGHPPARWRLTYFCGCVALICDHCKAEVEHTIEKWWGTITTVHCGSCRRRD